MGRPTHAARSRALSAPSTAVACGRPRRGAVAALVPRWSHGDDHLPGGRVTRALPPPAKGHGRGAWCKRRNRTAGGRWGPHLPGQPASRLHPHALVRAAFDNVGSDRHGLWVRHADTHAQSNTPGARGLTVRRSPSIGRASRSPEQITSRAEHDDEITTAVSVLLLAPRTHPNFVVRVPPKGPEGPAVPPFFRRDPSRRHVAGPPLAEAEDNGKD